MTDAPPRRAAFDITHPSDVAVARSAALHFARHHLSERAASHAAIIAGELASNLVRHAAGGRLELFVDDELGGVVVRSVDRGSRGAVPAGLLAPPREIPVMVEDSGAFTAGLGCGIGAIRRLSARFWVCRLPDESLEVAALCLAD